MKKILFISIPFFILVFIYLNIPYSSKDLYNFSIEKMEENINELNLYQSGDLDFVSVYKKSFKATLPFSQIIEYKKEKFIYNLALYNANGNEIPEYIKEILPSVKIQELTAENNRKPKYMFFQFLGVISVFLIIAIIYFIIKYTKPNFLNYYIFLLGLLYITNLVFLNLKSEKVMLTEKTLKQNFISN